MDHSNPDSNMAAQNTSNLSVLFVCLGNICRSPLAEGVLRHLIHERGLEDRVKVDSAGTGAWHVGEGPDRRSVAVAREHGIELEGQRARQVKAVDFQVYDLVIAMDRENLRNLEDLRGDDEADLHLLREFDAEAEEDLEVPDPYYGGPDGFNHVYRLVRRSCEALLDEVEGRLG